MCRTLYVISKASSSASVDWPLVKMVGLKYRSDYITFTLPLKIPFRVGYIGLAGFSFLALAPSADFQPVTDYGRQR